MLTSLTKLNRGNYKLWAEVFHSFLFMKSLLYDLERDKSVVILWVRNKAGVAVNQQAHDGSQDFNRFELNDEDVKSFMLMGVNAININNSRKATQLGEVKRRLKLCDLFDDIEEMKFPIIDHIYVNIIIIASISHNQLFENAWCSWFES